MKRISFALNVLALGLILPALGCSTTQPGVNNNFESFSTMLDATPDKVATAATKTLTQMKLTDITSTGTKIDGKVSGRTAQNDLVMIDIAQAGDNVSKMTVRVGVAGNALVSQQILDKTKENLHWFSSSEPRPTEMKNVLGTYSAMLDAAPDKVTKAATRTAEDMKLSNIASRNTLTDGNVSGRNAQDEAITINITQAGENVSMVSIRVGINGDETASRQIFDKIKGNLHWFPVTRPTSLRMKNDLGTFSSIFDGEPAKLTTASRQAAEQMKLADIWTVRTKVEGNVTAHNAQNGAISIDITQAGNNITKVSIRVGVAGNEAASQQIMDMILGNLRLL